MDIVRMRGGLGNQMFQYAFYQALKSRGRDAKISLGFFMRHPELRPFCLTEVFPQIVLDYVSEERFVEIDAAWQEIKKDPNALNGFVKDYKNRFFWVEDRSMHYYPEVFETQNCAFIGYWQSEKYFKDIRSRLLDDFAFMHGEVKYETLKKELQNHENYVSVHIRRGDYLKNMEMYGDLAASGYYKNAMEYMRQWVRNPVFVYFSDDMQWVKNHFPDKNGIFIEAEIFEDYQSWYDMSLMSCCSNHIIANSTFSWWGAWLNRKADKIVIAPKIWLYDRKTPDIWCDGWILM